MVGPVAKKQGRFLRHMVIRLVKLCGAVLAAQILGKFLSLWLKAGRSKRMLANVPVAHIESNPLLGNIPAIVKNLNRRHDFIMAASTTGGHKVTWTQGMFFDPKSIEIFVNDPVNIRHFLKDNFNNYTKGDPRHNHFWGTFGLWLGNGIFTALHGSGAPDGGQSWSRQRKITAAIFTRSNFNNNMNEIFVAKARHFCDALKAPANNGMPVDMQLQFFSYTMDSIMQIFFGEISDTLGGQSNKYATAFDTAHRNIFDFFMGNMAPLALTDLVPWPMNHIATHMIRSSSKSYKEFLKANAILDSESRRMIMTARADPKLSQRKDLLALYLQADAQEHFSETWLRDVVLNMIIAGRDTTACTLSWMFYMLATHPEIQEKVCREIDEKLPPDYEINFKSVGPNELPYLHGLLFECLRLYPPVPLDGKEAVADDILPDGTPIPKGAQIDWLPYTLGRDPERYPEPLVVKPERWIPFKEPQPHEFPVFQAGPRLCLGMNMAIMEAKIAAGVLLRDYTFEISAAEAEKITYLSTALTMSICNSKAQDSHNLWLTPKRRPGR